MRNYNFSRPTILRYQLMYLFTLVDAESQKLWLNTVRLIVVTVGAWNVGEPSSNFFKATCSILRTCKYITGFKVY